MRELRSSGQTKVQRTLNVPERLVYAPFIGAGFAWILVLVCVGPRFAKAVTITNGVYIIMRRLIKTQVFQDLVDYHKF